MAPSCASAARSDRDSERRNSACVESTLVWASDQKCLLSGLGRGQRALEGGPVGRPAVRRKHVLDRQCEERAQPLGDLLARDAGAEPPLVDLEALAEVDE